MAIHLTPEANPTVQEGTLFVDSATGEFNVAGRTVPHIIPGVLYPSYVASGTANKLLDGTTDHSGAFGTVQADGRKYYYTNIAGSKPIKDPRIGGHFGSQRHLLKSVQLLEQETATHGSNVYSVDGRDWIRCCATDKSFYTGNSTNGNGVFSGGGNSTSFFEITGYFNGINFSGFTHTSRGAEFSVNGGSASTSNFLTTSVMTPLRDRYVPAGSYVNLTSSLTLGINTIKIIPEGADTGFWFGIELIAQDTSNRNNIQIPNQNVVSYGKKFNVSGTPHYDPFNGFTSGSSVTSYIDTATSLGVEKWKNSSTYYRPYNGGRVVKWVDSSGVIKTSVTLMPPNAKSIGNSSSLTNGTAKANASASNDTFYPTFEAHTTDVNEDNLHEVAKTFHWREFGNGSANGNASYADASMLNTADDIAYVMDDGLTSLGADDVTPLVTPANALNLGGTDGVHITFIGTGISIFSSNWAENANAWNHIAQNLPYGTHVLKIYRDGSSNSTIHLDGVEVKGSTGTAPFKNPSEITFHQPKKPPIPEDAVVLCDYMLMADYVGIGATGTEYISKGIRLCSASRDLFYDNSGSGSIQLALTASRQTGFELYNTTSTTTTKGKLVGFGTNFTSRGWGPRRDLYVDGTDTASTDSGASAPHQYERLSSNLTLGVYTFEARANNSAYNLDAVEVATPIHTSFHYQTFETPFLHELVGGDRNMEQTNLVCSPDGKTWDQITRDTSYIGNLVLVANEDSQYGADTTVILNDRRGSEYTYRHYFNKDSFAIGYDRDICLKDGWYHINVRTASTGGGTTIHGLIRINGSAQTYSYPTDSGTTQSNGVSIFLKRGDYIEIRGKWNADGQYNNYEITRLR